MFSLKRISLLMFISVAISAQAQTQAMAIEMAQPAPAVDAAVPPPVVMSPMSAAAAQKIQSINEHMTVLNAQLAELDLQAKIAAKREEIRKRQGGPESVTKVFNPLESAAGSPSVVSVAGLRGSVEAVLVFPGGVVKRVKAGDVIGDRRVESVALNEVVLTDLKGRNIQRLGFGSSAVTRDPSAVQVSPGAMSPYPAPL